ncbi:MAG: response regulator [Myxococcaceae bacterium]
MDGLANGGRVAIIGGGVAANAMATALLFTARARGRNIEVRIYEGNREAAQHRPPALLTPECRSRLAALGCRIPADWRALELSGLEVISGGNRVLLRNNGGGLWVVDAWPGGVSGQEQVARGLASVSALHGAKFIPRRVDRVELVGRRWSDPAPMSGPGSVVVWGHGANERVHAAVLASGCEAAVSDQFFDGFVAPPTVSAAHARLRYGGLQDGIWPTAKLILNPLPGVDGVYLIPCRSSVYALAFGDAAAPADLCQALMMAARDGHLAEGFEIAWLSATRVPAGAARRLCAPGLVAVGPAALGHPLQLGFSETLAGCSRAAVALVEGASRRRRLERRYVQDGIFDLIEDAGAACRAVRWLRRCGDGAAEVLRRGNEKQRRRPWLGAGVLGLSSPGAAELAARARWAAIGRLFGGVWKDAVEPLPPSIPRFEPELYYVVDDDPDLREGLTQLLESRGAEVVAFADELALFCAVARRPPAAILLDVVMSWVDGLRLCEELKRHPLTRDTRVVVMSGLNRPHIRERALRAGAHAFLPKPVDAARLLRALDPGAEWSDLPRDRETALSPRAGEDSVAHHAS